MPTGNEAKFTAQQRRLRVAPDEPWPEVPGIVDVTLSPDLKEMLAISLDFAGHAAYVKAREQYQARDFATALATLRRAVRLAPANADARYQLAWYLATCPENALRNGDEAARLAKALCEETQWKQWTRVFALALAEAEAGRFDDALGRLKQALDLAPASARAKYGHLEDRFRRRQSL